MLADRGCWEGASTPNFSCRLRRNSQVPDCGQRATVGLGVFAARSQHPGGVNAVMLDGSARFFTSGVDTRVWRALGTRGGAEIVSNF